MKEATDNEWIRQELSGLQTLQVLNEQIKPNLSTHDLLHLLRNPYGHTSQEMDSVRRAAADRLEELEKQLKYTYDAYVNMRDWAEANGVDTKAYVGPH